MHHRNYILSRMEPELWVHLTALGFHPSMVFHASFMRNLGGRAFFHQDLKRGILGLGRPRLRLRVS